MGNLEVWQELVAGIAFGRQQQRAVARDPTMRPSRLCRGGFPAYVRGLSYRAHVAEILGGCVDNLPVGHPRVGGCGL